MIGKRVNQNKTVDTIDALVNKKNALQTLYRKQQRERDLKVDVINKKYGDKIDATLRQLDFVEMQMEQARIYAEKNLKGECRYENETGKIQRKH